MSPIQLFIQENLHINSTQITKGEYDFLVQVDSLAPLDIAQRQQFYEELFSGAYIFIPDNGQNYISLVATHQTDLINRYLSSSHESTNPQYALHGSVTGECIFGTKELNGVLGTWLQLESYSVDIIQNPAHMASYIVHVVTGLNSGPYGNSGYTEKNPLIVTPALNQDSTATAITLNDVLSDSKLNCLVDFPPIHSEIHTQETVLGIAYESTHPMFSITPPLPQTLEILNQNTMG